MITYNPYNWEIRPRKETIEELKNSRKEILDILFLSLQFNGEYVASRCIQQLVEIQEKIEKYHIENDMEDLVYI